MAVTRYFDDLEAGLGEISPARTVTEADVAAFAGLSGDFNPLHVDEVHAQAGPFGRRIAHGLLGMTIASGLFTRTELSASVQESLIALLAVEACFRAPIFFGDTLRVRATVVELKRSASGEHGVATLERSVLNQVGETTQEITTPMLIRTRLG